MLSPQYSLVMPFFNEAGNAGPLLAEALPVLRSLGGEFEIILVDDGSTDATPAELAAAAAHEPRSRVLRLPENRGQAAALLHGLGQARGAIILTMDGDGQNDPHDFPALLALVESGEADLACGWRVDRHDSRLRRAMSRVANAVRRRVLRDGVHDAGCQLRAFRRAVLAVVFPTPMAQTFLPAMAAAGGFKVCEAPVNHRPRRHGVSKYGFHRLWWRPACEMVALWWKLRRQRAS